MVHIYGLNMHKSLTPLKEGGLLLQTPAIFLAWEPHLRIFDRTAKKKTKLKYLATWGIIYSTTKEKMLEHVFMYQEAYVFYHACPDWSSRDVAAAIWIEDKNISY